jgi:parallel beta-helix repeat protein
MLTIVVLGLIFIGNVPIGNAQKCTNVSGIISQDTTWTPSNNPYNFTGDVTVASGVTLTIEPGTEVYQFVGVDSYIAPDDSRLHTLNVNGTLHAEGTDKDLIEFGNVNIGFGSSSQRWNSQSSSGSILQYTAGEHAVGTDNASPKIDNNNMLTIGVSGGSPIISNNVIVTEMDIEAGSPIISNNTITAESGGYPTELPAVNFEGQNSALFYGNHVTGDLSVSAGSPVIENNFISDGLVVLSAGSPCVENNLIQYGGITIYGETNPVIENNTIAACTIGINIYDSSGSPVPTIAYNNFEQNSKYNIYLGQQGNYSSTAPNVNAANNWWGTTDLSVINQTIYDHKDNFNVGTVTFTPILTSPNTQAAPNPNAPIPTPNPQTTSQPSQPTTTNPPTSTSTQSKNGNSTLSQTSLSVVIGVLLAVIFGLIAAVVVFWRRSKLPRTKAGIEAT